MTQPIRRVGVIGAGVMGSGIAAHLANAGVRVLLLDIVPRDLDDSEKSSRKARNRFADTGIQNALKAKPTPLFFHKSRVALVDTGNLEDDFDSLKDCDLIVEAIVERLDIKQSLFERLEKTIPETTIVASNTSGLRIKDMLEGRKDSFRKNFCVMHFFNPVRHMKLLELVAGPETSDETMGRVRKLGEDQLGKGIVIAKDTPNFVGNRIGTHAMLLGIHQMIEDKLTPEDVDAITGPPMGHPKSASFRTADLVGLDTLVHVADNCYAALENDPERDVFKLPEFIRGMLEKKFLGNKTKGGFYKKGKDGFETYDPYEGGYRAKAGDKAIKGKCKELGGIEDVRERVKKLFEDDGPAGTFAWKVNSRALLYAAKMVGEICDSIVAIDDSMRWGYNWELGPFETWDAMGFEAVLARMEKEGMEIPEAIKKMKASGAKAFYSDGKVFELAKGDYVTYEEDSRTLPLTKLRQGAPVLKNGSAEVYDLGDGVLGLTYLSKANSLDPEVIEMLGTATRKAEEDFEALCIINQGEHFSVGANLFGVLVAAQNKSWDDLDKMINELQQTVQQMRYSSIPIVAAPYGMTVGGGLEVCLAADAVQAHAETYSGLVEVGVGLIPGGGGTLNLMWKAFEGIPEGADVILQSIVAKVFMNIATANVAMSAEMGKEYGYFRHTDGVTFDKARLAVDAKARAVGMARSGYHPPAPKAYKLPGESGVATISMMIDSMVAGGFATEHDAFIGRKLARVLCGGAGGGSHPVTEQEILDLEREVFLSLCGEEKSQQRMMHMLQFNKPLRN